jgi:hypothetical protein
MNRKLLLACVAVLVCAIWLCSCDLTDPVFADPPADPPPIIGVTPIDTSAPTLKVMVTIDEDQDTADHMSNIIFQFRTIVIKENNFVIFDAEQRVTCNTALLKLVNVSKYTLKVPRYGDAQGRYQCDYVGATLGVSLPPVSMFDIAARSTLSPQPPGVNPQGYTIRYNADPDSLACPITAEALDSTKKPIQGPSSTSNLGIYVGPATQTLKGTGEIILARTCSWTWHNKPFDTLTLTYQSTASVEVTWTH